MDDKELARFEELIRENERLRAERTRFEQLIRENAMLLTTVEQLRAVIRARTVVPTQPYMSGRWHRRDGDIYGTVLQPLLKKRVADADSPPGNLRSTDQR